MEDRDKLSSAFVHAVQESAVVPPGWAVEVWEYFGVSPGVTLQLTDPYRVRYTMNLAPAWWGLPETPEQVVTLASQAMRVLTEGRRAATHLWAKTGAPIPAEIRGATECADLSGTVWCDRGGYGRWVGTLAGGRSDLVPVGTMARQFIMSEAQQAVLEAAVREGSFKDLRQHLRAVRVAHASRYGLAAWAKRLPVLHQVHEVPALEVPHPATREFECPSGAAYQYLVGPYGDGQELTYIHVYALKRTKRHLPEGRAVQVTMPAAEWEELERWMFRADIPRGFGPQTPPLLQQVCFGRVRTLATSYPTAVWKLVECLRQFEMWWRMSAADWPFDTVRPWSKKRLLGCAAGGEAEWYCR